MDSIIRMANDIARFHESCQPDEGMKLVAEHLNKFWPPAMRARFFELVQSDPSGFHPLVVAGAGMVRCNTHNPIKVEMMDKSGTGG